MKVTFKKGISNLKEKDEIFILELADGLAKYTVKPFSQDGRKSKYGILRLVVEEIDNSGVHCSNELNPHCVFSLDEKDKFFFTYEAAVRALQELEKFENSDQNKRFKEKQVDDITNFITSLYGELAKNLSDANSKENSDALKDFVQKIFNVKD